MNITQATLNDLEALAELFDGYRVFYEQSSDLDAAKTFLSQRIKKSESVIFLAKDDVDNALGFIQLYPVFSSVSMSSRWILNDLFVAEAARKNGVGKQLMQIAEDFAKNSGASGLSLSTASDNDIAQAMYEQLGWKKVTAFYHYNKSV